MPKNKLAFGVEPSTHSYRLRLARYQGLAEAIDSYLKSQPGLSRFNLIDVGVGNGRTLRYAEGQNHAIADRIRFVGVDLSPRRLAALYGPEHWQLVRSNVEQRLPFPSETFDIAICEQVLEHLHHPDAALREMNRILRPGGLLIVGVPIFFPPFDRVRRNVIPKLDRMLHLQRDHLQAFSLRSFKRLVRDKGPFEIIEARGFRVASGGPLAPLENARWWYRFQRSLGRKFPWACIETQVIARKPLQA